METRRLEYFVVLTAERHFGRAANRLCITQSALSQQIQRLERDLGGRLIDRSASQFTLTAAGEALLRRARAILEQVDEVAALASGVRSGEIGRVRVGVVPSLLYSGLPRAIKQFRDAHPEVEVDLRISPTSDLYDMVRLSQLDLAFSYTPPPAAEELGWALVYEDPYVVVVPDDHPLAGERDVDLSQLRDERILLSPRRDATEAHDEILGACVASGFSAHDITVERSSYTDQIGLVASGLGISLLPRRLAHVRPPGVHFLGLRTPVLKSKLIRTWNPQVRDLARDSLAETTLRALGPLQAGLP